MVEMRFLVWFMALNSPRGQSDEPFNYVSLWSPSALFQEPHHDSLRCCEINRAKERFKSKEAYFWVRRTFITKPQPLWWPPGSHTPTESCANAVACWAYFIDKHCIFHHLESSRPNKSYWSVTPNCKQSVGKWNWESIRGWCSTFCLSYHKPLAVNAMWKTSVDMAMFGKVIWAASVAALPCSHTNRNQCGLE